MKTIKQYPYIFPFTRHLALIAKGDLEGFSSCYKKSPPPPFYKRGENRA